MCPAVTAQTRAVTRGALWWLQQADICALLEVPLGNGRRADILGLDPSGAFHLIEVKASAQDLGRDRKWPAYRAFADHFYFAVPPELAAIVPFPEVGLLVCDRHEAVLLRPAPRHPLHPARRRALLVRFARLAAMRLAASAQRTPHAPSSSQLSIR